MFLLKLIVDCLSEVEFLTRPSLKGNILMHKEEVIIILLALFQNKRNGVKNGKKLTPGRSA